MLRYLTDDEIKDILDFIKPNKKLPPEMDNSVIQNNKNRLGNQLKKQKINPKIIPELKKQIKDNFFKSRVSPGESIGILAAQSIGERQTQNSLFFCAEILVKKRGTIAKTTIGAFIDSEMINITPDSHGNSIKQVNDVHVLTVSQTEKIEWKHVTELSKHPVNGDLVKVTTESGRSTTTTLSHSHLKKLGNSIVPILGSDLKIGDRIPVIRKSPKEERKLSKLYISKYINYVNEDEIESIILSADFHTKRIDTTIFDSNDTIKIRLISSFINLRGYADNKKEVLEDYQMLLTQFGILTNICLGNLKGHYLYIQRKYAISLSQLIGEKIPEEMVFEDFEQESYQPESDIIWDKIISLELIKEKDYEYKYVYDFSVKGNETFALFSGIVVHNTLNSIDWKENILYMENNDCVVEPIGKMIDNLLLKYPENIEKIEENRTEYLPLENGYFIPSCDEYGNTDWYEIEAITRHLPVGDLVKVTTESGREVMATQSKSFLVWNEEEKKFIATQGSDVKIGDILPTTEGLPRFTKNIQTHFKYICDKSVFNIELNREFGFIIGLFLTNNIDNLLFEKDIKERYDAWFNTDIKSDLFTIITDTYTKVPNFCFNANTDFLKGLLSGYLRNCKYSDNGFISVHNRFDNINNGILFLLTYFGVFGYIDSDKITIKNTTELDLNVIEEYWTDFQLSLYQISNLGRIRHTNSLKIYLEKGRYEGLKEPIEKTKVKNTVTFDKIKTIEFCKGTTEFVYDLTVKETKNFQIFNGLNIRDTFHKAGQSESSVTIGVPRFQELLNATKSPRMVNCKIFFNEGNETIQSLRNTINHNLVALNLKELSESIKLELNKSDEWWYDTFKILYNDAFDEFSHCITVKLNKKLMFKYRLTIEDIANKIEEEYDDLKCVFSPPSIAQLDIFVDVKNIKFTEKQLLFVTEENSNEIYLDECVQPILEKMNICGIPGILAIYYTRTETDPIEWFIETDGSNFRKLLGHPLFDMPRIQSNNVWDIYESLGIEAARQFLIDEFMQLMEGINICHVKLLVDKMTFCGNISSITRYTLRKDESGPMCRASFEESMDHYVKSSFNCEIEKTRGVSASIICGKRANIGTGFMDLKVDMNKLPIQKSVLFKTDNVVEDKGKIGKTSMIGYNMK